MKKKLIFIGYSHLTALNHAYARNAELKDQYDMKFISINVHNPDQNNDTPYEGIDGLRYNPYVLEQINLYGGFDCPNLIAVVSCLGGNQHNTVSMLSNKQPFDFYIPNHENLPFTENARCLEYRAVIEKLSSYLGNAPHLLKSLAHECKQAGVWFGHCSTPPMCPSNDYLFERLDAYFKRQIKATPDLEMSANHFRKKTWLCFEKIFEDLCKTNAFHYISPPEEMLDDNGYLVKEAWGQDATHASDVFGLSMLKKIISHNGASS